jgi:di/tricarboxylate transporter
MTPHGWLTVLVTVAMFVLLQRRGMPTDLVFLGGLILLTLAGVLRPDQAVSGFANTGVLMVGAMFVVAAALRNTGVLDWVGHRLFGSAATETSALRRLAAAMIPTSAFLPNTPLVAMMVPVVVDWCRKRRVSPSRLLIPLSYLVILGGVGTLVGTSSNIVANGMLKSEFAADQQRADDDRHSNGKLHAAKHNTAKYSDTFRNQLAEMGLFEIGMAGIPCALVGALFITIVAPRWLPYRKALVDELGEHRREYLVEMLVRPECRLIGQTVEAAGLRHLPGLFLIEINRGGDILTPVAPTDMIHADDRLVFTGIVATIVDMEKIPGLVPAADMAYEFHPDERQQRHMTEAVLSRTSPLIGATVREANFRQRYGAAVVAVHRNGVRLTNKIGNIVLEPGDTLLLQTRTDFAETFQNSRDFYLVSAVDGYTPVRHDRAWLATTLVAVLVAWLCADSLVPSAWTAVRAVTNPALASITIAALLVATRCLPMAAAREALDLQVLLTIAAALGIGKALETSGAARDIAHAAVGLSGDQPWFLLAAVYLLTLVFADLIGHTPVVAMLFPFVVALAAAGDYSPRPFVFGITIAASLSFLTPFGYQTNLMVMGPGAYHPIDYYRVGWPLTALTTIVALIVIPLIWPFAL